MTVLDASVVVDLLLRSTRDFDAVAARIAAEAPRLAAPHLLDAEVAQVLRRFVRSGDLSPSRATEALIDLDGLPVTRYPHLPLLRRAFSLRENATIYDALYLTLAEALGGPLLTRDRALASVPGHRVRVEVLS